MLQTFSIIYKLILSLICLVYSPEQKTLHFPIFNCYESFSRPKLRLKIFFYTPSGPEFMVVEFNSYFLFSNQTQKRSEQNGRYQLKKIKGNCENSDIIFTTNGIEISAMKIEVLFFMFKSFPAFTVFDYWFKNGFKTGNHTLIDQYGNFGISVQVTNSKNQFIKTLLKDEREIKNYLSTLENNNYYICILTENNNAVVIKPIFDSLKNQGYIIKIKAEMAYYRQYEFHAFACTVNESYVDSYVVFITEGYPPLQFKAYSIQFDYSDHLVFRDIPFYVNGINRSSFYRSLSLSKNIKKVFLMNKNMKRKRCPDNSFLVTYHSQNGTKYYEFIMEIFKIENKVEKLSFDKSLRDETC